MVTGRSIQLNKQIGEYLVASELARRGWLVATFSGNVPDFDIMAGNETGQSIPIQVKTIRKGHWQFSVDKFVKVKIIGKKQVLGSIVDPRVPHLLCVFVLATEYGKDRFFILEWEQLRDIAVASYTSNLNAKNGVRPRRYKSLHYAISPKELTEYENQWDKVSEQLKQP